MPACMKARRIRGEKELLSVRSEFVYAPAFPGPFAECLPCVITVLSSEEPPDHVPAFAEAYFLVKVPEDQEDGS